MTGQVHTQATPLGISSTPRGSRLGLILLLSLDLHRLGLILHAFQRLGLILHGRLGLSFMTFMAFIALVPFAALFLVSGRWLRVITVYPFMG